MLILAAVVYAQVATNPLAGLWEAKRRFGPDARGAIVLRREGAAWTADFIGRVTPVREERGLLTFSIPEGSFRAVIEKDGIHGHWTQPNRLATPVHLQPDGAQRWRG